MKKKILVIEDDPTLLHMYRSMLENAGFEVMLSENGQDGLDKIDRYKPDLILLDILMPIMSGFDVLKNLGTESHKNHAPVIVLTCLNREDEEQKAKLLGADDFIRKDEVHLTELVDKINHFVA